MITWELLKKYELMPPKSSKTYRTKEINDAYENHKNKLKQQNLTLSKYITKTLFNNNNKELVRLELNPFSYNVDENVSHFILWLNPLIEHPNNIDLKTLIPYPYSEYTDDKIAIISNSLDARSIPEIEHIHLFIR